MKEKRQKEKTIPGVLFSYFERSISWEKRRQVFLVTKKEIEEFLILYVFVVLLYWQMKIYCATVRKGTPKCVFRDGGRRAPMPVYLFAKRKLFSHVG